MSDFGLTKAVHGKNPESLIEAILKQRIFRNNYWKEKCFGLTAASLTEVAMELPYFGGTFGGNKQPTPFICLVLAMLQIQPEKEIIVEYIKNEDYKYVRALGAFYLRLVGTPSEIYQYLEPLYYDYRKLKKRTDTGYVLVHMDEFIDELLWDKYACDISLPFLPRRWTLEAAGHLQPRVSVLDDELKAMLAKEKEEEEKAAKAARRADDSGDDRLEREYRDRSRRERWRKRRSRSMSRSRDRSSRSRRDDSRERRSSRDRKRQRSSSRERYREGRERDDRSRRRRDDDRRRDDRHRDDRHRDSRYRDDDRHSRSRRSESQRSPPSKRRRTEPSPPRAKSKNGEISMGVSETNALRASLGLPPLKDSGSKPDAARSSRRRSPPRREETPAKKKSGEVSMSVSETNALRAKLGLPPLH